MTLGVEAVRSSKSSRMSATKKLIKFRFSFFFLSIYSYNIYLYLLCCGWDELYIPQRVVRITGSCLKPRGLDTTAEAMG